MVVTIFFVISSVDIMSFGCIKLGLIELTDYCQILIPITTLLIIATLYDVTNPHEYSKWLQTLTNSNLCNFLISH